MRVDWRTTDGTGGQLVFAEKLRRPGIFQTGLLEIRTIVRAMA